MVDISVAGVSVDVSPGKSTYSTAMRSGCVARKLSVRSVGPSENRAVWALGAAIQVPFARPFTRNVSGTTLATAAFTVTSPSDGLSCTRASPWALVTVDDAESVPPLVVHATGMFGRLA